jgi:hypothetical protein
VADESNKQSKRDRQYEEIGDALAALARPLRVRYANSPGSPEMVEVPSG